MIAKGKTEIRAEIDFMFEAYKSLICRTEKSYQDDIDEIKSTIKSIDNDSSMEFEEKKLFSTLIMKYLKTLVSNPKNLR